MIPLVLTLLAGCGPANDTYDLFAEYSVDWHTDPASPVAGETAEVWMQVLDPEGVPVEGLQQNHDRIVHTFVISRDLSSFQHVHHEDFYEITADDLRNSTFHFPVVFPMSGEYVLAFDFAHENQFHYDKGSLLVTGEPAQADAPDLAVATTATARELTVTLEWVVPPVAGAMAEWKITVQTSEGEDVTDLVQYLGADAHAALVSADLLWIDHTHAWIEGIEDMAPGHEMDHVYDGPEVLFKYGFPSAGAHKMWLQFTREGAPDEPYTVPFVFEVAAG